MSEDRYTRITLRLPKELHKRLAENADLTSKSTNAEIVERLEGSFNPYESKSLESLKMGIELLTQYVNKTIDENNRLRKEVR